MAGKSRKRGLDRTDERPGGSPTGHTLHTFGIIGRRHITETEKEDLTYIGRCIARLGHSIASIPTEGTETAVREGVKAEGGEIRDLDKDVIEQTDHTLIYPDKALLTRLLTRYPDLQTRDDVTIIKPDEISGYAAALTNILWHKNLGTPPRQLEPTPGW